MTIAALLSHFGASTPRYVTVNGQIIFDDVVVQQNGDPLHAQHGPVTPVERHTFHGGAEGSDEPVAGSPWWEKPELIARHITAMQKAFPSFAYVAPEAEALPAWIGTIDTGRGKFTIGIILREDQGLPRVVMLSKIQLGASAGRRWVPSPHLYDNGNLCVADAAEWAPERHTAATVTAWAAHWLAAYTEWRMARKWPVAGVASDAA